MKKITSRVLALTVFLVIFGGIGATILTDLWTTKSTKTPVTFPDGEFKGQYNPADIRGSYTFTEVAELFQVKLSDLYDAFGIPAGTDGTTIQTKVLEEMYPDLPHEIGNGSVQLFVALYKGLPAELDGDTYLPAPAREILLKTNSRLTGDQKAYVESHLQALTLPGVDGTLTTPSSGSGSSNTSSSGSGTSTLPKTTAADHVEPLVKGATTFQQVLDAGITQVQIETILGAAMPPGNTTIKAYCLEQGISFSEIKDQLNALADR